MKKLLVIPVLALFALSCTEEIIRIVEVTKDSLIYVPAVPEQIFIGIDTVYLPVTLPPNDPDLDSIVIYVTVLDSIFITEKVVEHHYHDTLYVYSGRDITALKEYQDIYIEFYTLCQQYGVQPVQHAELLIEYWPGEEAPAKWSAFSFIFYGQWVIRIRDNISVDEAYTPILREMAKDQLGKRYSEDPNSLMNPEFDWTRLKMSSTDEEKKPYLDELFNKGI